MPRFALLLVVLAPAVACGGAHRAPPSEPGHHPAAASPTAHHAEPPEDEGLRAVASVHGGAGPWAVAGYRMGEFALRELGLPRGSFDLEVVHFTPESVQYSCIADGAAAATGASLGKLNLKLAGATPFGDADDLPQQEERSGADARAHGRVQGSFQRRAARRAREGRT